DAVVRDLAIRRHPTPSLEAPVPLGASNIVFRNLTNDLSGTIDYRASGLACALLQVAGLKCEDRVDLAGRPPNVVAELPAVWSIQDGVLRITGTFSFREDINTAHPEIGYVGGKVTLTAAGPIRPVLRMQPATDRLEFRWCSSFATARLEAAPNLDATSWQALPADPETSGTDRTVRIPKPATATFYRLRTDP
ncbi:MAG: hypothetical protein JNL97_13470, partial [Verrucomicrobiales bacterium]|nr:hypothetical protein [Verrucomicrobiales bacterium]